MTLTFPVIVHTATGLIAFGAAIAALSWRKGGLVHRRAGRVFVVAMALMAGSGALIALSMQVVLSVIGGAITLYLVLTGWLTVMRKNNQSGLAEVAGLLIVLFIAGLAWTSGLEAANSATGLKDGFHPAQYYMFGVLAFIAAAGDIQFILRGGLSGRQRIARHLWRMCMGLTIAASAFFLGQARLFPETIQASGLLPVPVLLVLLIMFFWLARLLWSSIRRPAPAVASASHRNTP